MIRDPKEARKAFEREKKKAESKLLQRKKGETVGLRDIQVKQGLEIPTMNVNDELPPVEQSPVVERKPSLSKKRTIRKVRRETK